MNIIYHPSDLAKSIMRTQREIIRIASLLFCLHLSFVFSLLGAAWRGPSENATDAFANQAAVRRTVETTAPRQTPALDREISQVQYLPQWRPNEWGYSDLVEDESQSPFNTPLRTAPHILFSLTGWKLRSSARMNPAGTLSRLYLLNSVLRC